MPNELRLQSLVVRAVNSHGGFAFKLSNRFLVGVPDLLIHLPNTGTGIWEVKSCEMGKLREQFTLKVTPLQDKFLRVMSKAGGTCGVISFIEIGRDVFMAAYQYDIIAYKDAFLKKFVVSGKSHKVLPRGRREKTIVSIMGEAYGRPI